MARFREVTGVYPARITIVGHDFKRRRFEQLHPLALCWSKHHFTYVGISLGAEADECKAASGERANAFVLYSTDPYDCHAPFVQKRSGRNLVHGYHVGAPEMRELVEWCPEDDTRIYPGSLPCAKE